MDERGLGKQLQAARQAAGLTQQQLCAAANLSFSTLTKIERGAIKSPSIFTIQSIAGALGVGLDELIGQVAPGQTGRQLKTTKSGAKFIYFDIHGCLVYDSQRALTNMAAAIGITPDLVESAFWHYNDDACRGIISMSDFDRKLGKRLGVEDISWNDYYLEALEPIEGMTELVQKAAQNYKIGLMSNIMPGQLSAARRAGRLPNVTYDGIVDSSETGVIKPEEQAYLIAQEKAGVPPEEILLIDDDRGNLMAAEKLGWKVMLFDASRPQEAVARVREALEPAE